MAYGSAPGADDGAVRDYLAHILRFYRRAAPTDAEVQHLKARYAAIGGSPLYAITQRIAARVQEALDQRVPGAFRVFTAMKHSPPFIEDVTREIGESGLQRAVGVALAPFRSRLSTHGYYQLVTDTNGALPRPVAWRFVGQWHLHPTFLDLWARRIAVALDGPGRDALVVFTNHSLPARVREWGDPYEEAFAATARALADRLGLSDWTTAYQSAGGGNGPWLGPSLDEVLREHAARGRRRVLVAPIGFLMDHLEILHDLDIAAQRVAGELGVTLTRTAMPNDDPLLIALLAELVRETAP